MHTLSFLPALGLCSTILAATPATAQSYAIHDLGIPPQTQYSQSAGINQSGQVIGYGGNIIGGFFPQPAYSFLYSDGKLTQLNFNALAIAGGESLEGHHDEGKRKLRITGSTDNFTTDTNVFAVLYEDHLLRVLGALPGDFSSSGAAVNSLGEVAGVSFSESSERAFLYSKGNMIDLGYFPGGSGAQALGINDWGEVTGEAFLANGQGHAFLYRKDKLIDLGTLPGAVFSVGTAINNAQQLTGYAFSADYSLFHAFLWNRGKMIDLGILPTGSQSEGKSINVRGQVVGQADVADPGFAGSYLIHAFLYNDGKMHDLNDLIPANSGYVIQDAVGINDRGEIAAIAGLHGVMHAVVLRIDCKDAKSKNCEACRNSH